MLNNEEERRRKITEDRELEDFLYKYSTPEEIE
jgi:hypothetical protein